MIVIMDTKTAPATSVTVHERGQDQQFDSIDTPQKQTARGHAVLCAMNYLPIKALPMVINETGTSTRANEELSTPAIDYLQTIGTVESTTPTPERESKKERRMSKIRRALGMAVTRANMLVLGVYGAPAKFSEAEKEWRSREELQRQEGDNLITRAQKAVGRNAIRGLALGGGAAAYMGVAYANTHGHELPRFVDNADVQTLEVTKLAKTTFYIGGRGDGDAILYTNRQKELGLFDESAINKRASYPASIAPLDPISLEDSTDIAANQMVQTVIDAKGGPVEVHSFSEGAVAASEGVRRLEAQGIDTSNLTVYIDDGPDGPGGFFDGPHVNAVEPFLDAFGIDTNKQIEFDTDAKVVYRRYSGSLWGSGGNDSSASVLSQAFTVGATHRAFEGGTLLAEQTIGNTTFQEYSYPSGMINPISEQLHQSGAMVTPAADRLIDSMLPVTHLGEETQYADVNEVRGATSDFITDTIRINNGVEAGHIVAPIVDAVMDDKVSSNVQALLDVGNKTPDKFVEMINDPTKIPQNMEAIGQDLEAGMQAVGTFMNPGTWMEMLNDGIRGAGVPIPEYVAPPPAPVTVYAPGPEQFAPAAPPPPPPPPMGNPFAEAQANINQFGDNLRNAFANFGKQ